MFEMFHDKIQEKKLKQKNTIDSVYSRHVSSDQRLQRANGSPVVLPSAGTYTTAESHGQSRFAPSCSGILASLPKIFHPESVLTNLCNKSLELPEQPNTSDTERNDSSSTVNRNNQMLERSSKDGET